MNFMSTIYTVTSMSETIVVVTEMVVSERRAKKGRKQANCNIVPIAPILSLTVRDRGELFANISQWLLCRNEYHFTRLPTLKLYAW